MDGFSKQALAPGRDPPSPNLWLSLCIYLIKKTLKTDMLAFITSQHVYEILKLNKNMWVCIYIYIKRDRDRGREGGRGREKM